MSVKEGGEPRDKVEPYLFLYLSSTSLNEEGLHLCSDCFPARSSPTLRNPVFRGHLSFFKLGIGRMQQAFVLGRTWCSRPLSWMGLAMVGSLPRLSLAISPLGRTCFSGLPS
ncbi:UNVERIFIED_CONTAM: hypothetical protein Sindi_0946200 [Sesamum indicum]